MAASRLVPIVALGAIGGALALVQVYGGGRSEHGEQLAPEPTRTLNAAADLEPGATEGPQAPSTSAPVEPVPDSALQTFLEVRGVPLPPHAEQALREFVAQPRDPSWSAGMEGQFQSALTQSGLSDAEAYVECRRSMCVVLFVFPPGTHEESTPLTLRATVAEHQRLLSTLRLYGTGAMALRARSGALAEWHRFHRRCGPEWQCLAGVDDALVPK